MKLEIFSIPNRFQFLPAAFLSVTMNTADFVLSHVLHKELFLATIFYNRVALFPFQDFICSTFCIIETFSIGEISTLKTYITWYKIYTLKVEVLHVPL
jgi:hypothetical protein